MGIQHGLRVGLTSCKANRPVGLDTLKWSIHGMKRLPDCTTNSQRGKKPTSATASDVHLKQTRAVVWRCSPTTSATWGKWDAVRRRVPDLESFGRFHVQWGTANEAGESAFSGACPPGFLAIGGQHWLPNHRNKSFTLSLQHPIQSNDPARWIMYRFPKTLSTWSSTTKAFVPTEEELGASWGWFQGGPSSNLQASAPYSSRPLITSAACVQRVFLAISYSNSFHFCTLSLLLFAW
jgi:hypothetical protein